MTYTQSSPIDAHRHDIASIDPTACDAASGIALRITTVRA
jgi:hypothetical protein